MMERRAQAIMDRLDGLLGIRGGSVNRGAHTREASREPRVNFNERSNRGGKYGSTRGRSNSSSGATGCNRPRKPTNIRRGATGSRPISNERPTRDKRLNRRRDCSNWNYSKEGIAQPSDSDRRNFPEPTELRSQAGYSRVATAMATAFQPLNRFLEIFLTSWSRTIERSEMSKRVFKKPRCN